MIPVAVIKHWKLAVIGLLVLALGYQTLTKRATEAELSAALTTIKSMDEQAKATAKRWAAKSETLAAKAKAIKKDILHEKARIIADRDAALDELRTRPRRNTPAISTPATGTCKAPAGGTGAFLFREDAEFLTREAARADIIRTSLKACYAQYDNARDALAEEQLGANDETATTQR